MKMKKMLSCMLLALVVLFAPPALAELTKADVEKIVQDYIMKNPQVILTSVDEYQKKSVQTRQGEALQQNSGAIFNDASSPVAGNPKGDVTVVKFSDYNCGYCKRAFEAVNSLLTKDKNVRFVFKDFPILGPSSKAAADWALAAQRQGKYFEFYKAMMLNKKPITDELLEKVAKDTGLDVTRAKKDAASKEVADQLDKNLALASSLGLSGTPVFIVGDTIIPGAVPVEELETLVSAARAKAKAKK